MNSSYRHIYRLTSKAIPAVVVLAGATLLFFSGLQLSELPGMLPGSIGSFLIVSGVQVALWALGIRVELLGNAVEPTDANGPKNKFANVAPQGSRADRANEAFTGFKVLGFDEALRRTLADLERIEEAVAFIGGGKIDDDLFGLLELDARSPVKAVISISAKVESAAITFTPWVRVPEVRFEGAEYPEIMPLAARAYRAFRELRNSVLYNREVQVDERMMFQVFDVVTRLQAVLATIGEELPPNEWPAADVWRRR